MNLVKIEVIKEGSDMKPQWVCEGCYFCSSSDFCNRKDFTNFPCVDESTRTHYIYITIKDLLNKL
jgi:hypothetical protein